MVPPCLSEKTGPLWFAISGETRHIVLPVNTSGEFNLRRSGSACQFTLVHWFPAGWFTAPKQARKL